MNFRRMRSSFALLCGNILFKEDGWIQSGYGAWLPKWAWVFSILFGLLAVVVLKFPKEEHKNGYVTECDWRSGNSFFGACFLLRCKSGMSEDPEEECGA